VEGTDDTNSQSHDGWKEKLVRSVSTNRNIRKRGHDDVFSLIYPRHVAYSIAVRHYDYDMNDFKNHLISIVV
jgi:hypothetical protein